MRASKTLPYTYREARNFDVRTNTRLLLVLNVVGLVLLVVMGFLFFQAIFWLRPPGSFGSAGLLEVGSIGGALLLIAVVLGLTVFHIILHEAVHGIFFWLFTRSRPEFALRLTYAYAAAPQWYLPRIPFLITTLAPFVLISLAGLVVYRYAPPSLLLPTWLVITMNAAGAVGDLLVAFWLLRLPPTSLVQDRGDRITFYVQEKPIEKVERIS